MLNTLKLKKISLVKLTLLILSLIMALFFFGCTAPATNPDGGAGVENEEIKEENNGEENGEIADKEKEEEKEEEICPEEKKAEERREQEVALQEELGEFFVPLPPLEKEENPPVKARGIYVTGNSAGYEERFNRLLEMIETSELNTMVIDVKNDHGIITYPSEIEIAQEVQEGQAVPVRDIGEVMDRLEKRDIYPIARIVVFRDPLLSRHYPEWFLQRKEGGVWEDGKGFKWSSPYMKEVWDYNIAIAKEAALMGFREIQFDYVRFPENAERLDREANFPGQDDRSKEEIIRDFLIYAGEELEEYNVYLSADVFGVISTSWGDSDEIGQNWEKLTPYVDYICPMVYPSHYGPGYFGYSVPDAEPAGTVRHGLKDAVKRNAPVEDPAIIRPYLQGFTASWVRGNISYGPQEVRAQINAALELGIDEYLIWNARNRYNPDFFLTEEAARQERERILKEREEEGRCTLNKTAREALVDYLEGVKEKDWRKTYLLHSTDFSIDYREYRDWVEEWVSGPYSYEITDSQEEREGKSYELDLVIRAGEEELKLEGQTFKVYKENKIWRVSPPSLFTDLLTRAPRPRDQ